MSEAVLIALIAGLCAGIPQTIVALSSRKSANRKLDQIHVLVNDRLDAALAKIEALEKAARQNN